MTFPSNELVPIQGTRPISNSHAGCEHGIAVWLTGLLVCAWVRVSLAGTCSKQFEYVQHDATTISQLRSLYQRQKEVIEFVDGFVMGCGKFIEIRWSCWLILHDGRPQYFFLSAPDSAIVHIACTYQQAKRLASTSSAAVAAPGTQRMERASSAFACLCAQAGGASSWVRCSSDCVSCSAASCRSASSPPSPAESLPSAATAACHCCTPCSCSTTVPCGCPPPHGNMHAVTEGVWCRNSANSV